MLLIKNGWVVSPTETRKADVLIENEKIIQVAEAIPAPPGAEVLDAEGKYVLPGVIDAHTHCLLRSRGTVTADDFYSGTISAACGGVTTIIDYADQVPGKSMTESVKDRIAEADGEAVIDFSLHLTTTRLPTDLPKQLRELKQFGIPSLKIFTTYKNAGYLLPQAELERLLVAAREEGLLVTVHAEDDDLVESLQAEFMKAGRTAPGEHAHSRPGKAEALAIAAMIDRVRKLHTPLYFVHVSTAEGAEHIRQAKAEGLPVLGETTPHYLLLTDDLYHENPAQPYIMTPPLRQAKDNEALWQGLADNTLSVVATDHCAFTIEQKLAGTSCFDTLPGIPGLETLLPLIYSEGVVTQRITINRLVEVLTANPAKIFGLYPRKGCLSPGADGDLVIYRPNGTSTLTAASLHSRAGYTPFAGRTVTGFPETTILRGQIIAHQGRWCGVKGQGRFIPAYRS